MLTVKERLTVLYDNEKRRLEALQMQRDNIKLYIKPDLYDISAASYLESKEELERKEEEIMKQESYIKGIEIAKERACEE